MVESSHVEIPPIISNYPRGEEAAIQRSQVKTMLQFQNLLHWLTGISVLFVNGFALMLALINTDSPPTYAAFLSFAISIWIAHLLLSVKYAWQVSKANGWSQADSVRVTLYLIASGIPIVGALGPLFAQHRLADDGFRMGLPMKGNRINRKALAKGEGSWNQN